VPDVGGDAVFDEGIAGGGDLVVGYTQKCGVRTVHRRGDSLAAGDSNLDSGGARRARQRPAGAAGADDREHEWLRVGSLL
jgi:hypothetical protein